MPFAFTLTSGCTLPQVSRVKDPIHYSNGFNYRCFKLDKQQEGVIIKIRDDHENSKKIDELEVKNILFTGSHGTGKTVLLMEVCFMRLFFCLSILKLSTDKYLKIQLYIVAGSIQGSNYDLKINAKVLLDELRTKYVNIFGDYENNEHLMEPIFTEFKGTVCFILLQTHPYNKNM